MSKVQAQGNKLLLSKEGLWFIDGGEITHARTLEVLNKNLYRTPEGIFVQIGREQAWIDVEDTIYFVVSLEGTPDTGFKLTLSDETQEELDPTTLIYSNERLVCRVKGGLEEAKFLRGPYHEILKHVIEGEKGYILRCGSRHITVVEFGRIQQ
ncbi:hypothetical protein WDW86_17480 [Bdellovibrionota bacterium FG-2]